MNHRLDLREIAHPPLSRGALDERHETDSDGLSTRTQSLLDGLPVRPVGEWAYDKIYRLVQYFGIFAGGMKKPVDRAKLRGDLQRTRAVRDARIPR